MSNDQDYDTWLWVAIIVIKLCFEEAWTRLCLSSCQITSLLSLDKALLDLLCSCGWTLVCTYSHLVLCTSVDLTPLDNSQPEAASSTHQSDVGAIHHSKEASSTQISFQDYFPWKIILSGFWRCQREMQPYVLLVVY